MKTVCHPLTLKTINKSYTNNYTDKYNKFVTQVNQQQQCVREEDRQAMWTKFANNNAVAVEFSRKREHQYFISRTFVRLIVLNYKRARQDRRQSVRMQSTLCEVACEENSCGLKIFFVKSYRTVKQDQPNCVKM